MHDGSLTSHVVSVHTILDRVKVAIKEVQANITISQSWENVQMDHLRCDEKHEVGDEIALSRCQLHMK